MSTVATVTQTGTVSATSQGTSIGNLATILSGEMVKQYDEQIELFTQELTIINNKKAQMTADKAAVMGLPTTVPTSAENNGALAGQDCVLVPKSEYTELEKLADKYGLHGKLDAATDKHLENDGVEGNDSYIVTEDFLEALKETIDGKLQNLNTSSEMQMIQFQVLMDARKQSMLMLSNLLNQDTQTKMAIIQNMKG